MQYLLLIYSNEADASNTSEEERGAIYQAYGEFTKDIQEKGLMKAGDALQPVATATSVQVRDGQTITSDGPFAETKEQLGGYYLVDVENLDQAIEVASRIPTATHGTIEVRPIIEIEW